MVLNIYFIILYPPQTGRNPAGSGLGLGRAEISSWPRRDSSWPTRDASWPRRDSSWARRDSSWPTRDSSWPARRGVRLKLVRKREEKKIMITGALELFYAMRKQLQG